MTSPKGWASQILNGETLQNGRPRNGPAYGLHPEAHVYSASLTRVQQGSVVRGAGINSIAGSDGTRTVVGKLYKYVYYVNIHNVKLSVFPLKVRFNGREKAA
jgi:hypothetical protein